MKVLILAVCVALCAAWTPGPRDVCNPTNVDGGTQLLPHEKYCQLFYMCGQGGFTGVSKQEEQACSVETLFAYGLGTATCVISGTAYICPKWPCASLSDIGRNYPDLCCDKFWTCEAIGRYTQQKCPDDRPNFDSVSETCTATPNVCEPSTFCRDIMIDNGQTACYDRPASNGDLCSYQTEGTSDIRPCPYGVSFDPNRCACLVQNDACRYKDNSLTYDEMHRNKDFDITCRASGRLDLTNQALVTFSDKINKVIPHYFYRLHPGITFNGLEVIMDNTNIANPDNRPFMLYDYFYNDVTLFAPLAITMTVRLDQTNNVLNNVEIPLLENRWSTDVNNDHCSAVSLRFTARYTGFTQQTQLHNWVFSIGAIGMSGVEATGSASITGATSDYYRIVFRFGGQISGTVSNRGNTGTNTDNQRTVNFSGNDISRNLGGALRPNKCGFAIGRGLIGRIREFNVYEGCGNFNSLG